LAGRDVPLNGKWRLSLIGVPKCSMAAKYIAVAECLNANAELQFRCLDAGDPELRRPTLKSEPDVKISIE